MAMHLTFNQGIVSSSLIRDTRQYGHNGSSVSHCNGRRESGFDSRNVHKFYKGR